MPQKHDIITLKKRRSFLAVAATVKKWVAPGLILQLGPVRPDSTPPENPVCHYGLTASGKVGNAVVRNRARRRLRALAQELLALHADPSHDYVLIARNTTATRAHEALRLDFITALKKLKVWRESPP